MVEIFTLRKRFDWNNKIVVHLTIKNDYYMNDKIFD